MNDSFDEFVALMDRLEAARPRESAERREQLEVVSAAHEMTQRTLHECRLTCEALTAEVAQLKRELAQARAAMPRDLASRRRLREMLERERGKADVLREQNRALREDLRRISEKTPDNALFGLHARGDRA